MPLDITPAAGDDQEMLQTPQAAPAAAGPPKLPTTKSVSGTDAKAEDVISKLPQADPNFDPMKSPIVQAVFNASIPGVTFTDADLKNPQVAPLAANARNLVEAGLGVVGLKDGRKALFNPHVITPAEILKADKKGTLDKALIPFSKAGGAADSSGPAAPQADNAAGSNSNQPPSTAGAGEGPGPSQMDPQLSGKTLPAGAQRRIASVRSDAAMKSSTPATAAPAAGGILGRVLNPVV
jgi:hypothetical protein